MIRTDGQAHLTEETRQKSEEHKRKWLKLEEGLRLALEARYREEEEEEHTQIEAEEEARIVEE